MQPAEVLGAPRKGLRFVFSGDSAPCPALEQAAQGADLLLCDADSYALPEQQEQAAQWGHSTLGPERGAGGKGRAKRLWLRTIPPWSPTWRSSLHRRKALPSGRMRL